MDIIGEFEKRTTYFKGFEDNRKNIYTEKSHSTSIGYRLVHENLPKFLTNINRYKKLKQLLPLDGITAELEKFFNLDGFNLVTTQDGIDEYNRIVGGEFLEGKRIKKKGINEEINLHIQELRSRAKENGTELKEEIRRVQSLKMEKLHKQILSDRDTSATRREISNDGELCQMLLSGFRVENGDLIGYRESNNEKECHTTEINLTKKIENLCTKINDFDLEKIYINSQSLSYLSNEILRIGALSKML